MNRENEPSTLLEGRTRRESTQYSAGPTEHINQESKAPGLDALNPALQDSSPRIRRSRDAENQPVQHRNHRRRRQQDAGISGYRHGVYRRALRQRASLYQE